MIPVKRNTLELNPLEQHNLNKEIEYISSNNAYIIRVYKRFGERQREAHLQRLMIALVKFVTENLSYI